MRGRSNSASPSHDDDRRSTDMMNRATAVALATAFFVCTAGLTADRGKTAGKTTPGRAKTTEPPAPFAGVSLKIADEKVPPGGIAQGKLFVTDAPPICTARAQ